MSLFYVNFSYWVILTSLFEWKLLFSLLWLSLSLTTFSNKRVILELLLFSSSCRKVISFSIWWRSFSVVFWSLRADFWHRKSLLNCKTSVIKECIKELNCSWRLGLNLSSCNWKTSKSPYFAFSFGRDKHYLSPTVGSLTALLSTIFWSSSSNVSRVVSVSRELWTRLNTPFLPHYFTAPFQHWYTCNNQHFSFVVLNMVGSTI